MAADADALVLSTDFDPETGKPVIVAPQTIRITAPNAGPYTFTGTNSFLVGEDRLYVIDPGPDDARHLHALNAAIAGRPVDAIILTHTHTDHCALVPKLRSLTGAPVWSGGRHRLSRPKRVFEINAVSGSSDWALQPDRVLADGEALGALSVMTSPGHCANHLSFGLTGTPWLLTGDHIMGWSSTLVSTPDGSMDDYFASLEKVIAAPYAHYLPAHGGAVMTGPAHARALLAHRQARDRQIIAAIASGTTGLGALVKAIYPTLALHLHAAARMTLTAHIEHLETAGTITVRRTLFGMRLSPA